MGSSSQNSLQSFYQNSLEELKDLFGHVQEMYLIGVTDSRVDWEIIYDRVFSERCSRRVFTLCNELGSSLDYYDPDTSYEEDVAAFYWALKDKVTQFERLNI